MQPVFNATLFYINKVQVGKEDLMLSIIHHKMKLLL